ncbi:type IV pilin N-terminal domain-containing protein [Methanonatronarchaeum sp. AMET-Sl]|uniref:type IV pilin N-terminal domain-containing protein n=1 Tax=Methanonatronarchaeum sp. AMET-Sl TaxID=3037654 RepID=UPI00244DBA98|nr:type IV pilin N-terminal domain-containing protein [Methanonatronarchaeum sp. AMET-Sl]WGI18057.1 type IV pilin N-terminal domain-containing protein [Methanonatronarchaeum sp. AMET-Sl]
MDLNKIKADMKKEDGVSPVIGVILMVAIVVLLAAIVAAFVFGVVTIPEPTPQASTTIEEATWDGDEELNVTLLHQSGSSLDAQDTQVIITNLDNTSQTNTTTISDWDVDNEWSTGERISMTFEASDFKDNNGNSWNDDGVSEIEVRLVDEPSGGTISVMTSSVTEL